MLCEDVILMVKTSREGDVIIGDLNKAEVVGMKRKEVILQRYKIMILNYFGYDLDDWLLTLDWMDSP